MPFQPTYAILPNNHPHLNPRLYLHLHIHIHTQHHDQCVLCFYSNSFLSRRARRKQTESRSILGLLVHRSYVMFNEFE